MEVACVSFGSSWSGPLPEWDSNRTLVLAFGAPGFQRIGRPFAELRARYPHAHFLGCSTAGEILGARVSDETLAVAIVRFEGTGIASAATQLEGVSDSFGAGARLAQALLAPRGASDPLRGRLRGVLVISDGLGVNGSDLVRGLASLLPPDVVVSGGLAADGDRFRSTWVLSRRGPTTSTVAAVGVYGDRVQVGCGSQGGWDLFGLERRVTSSRGNVLYEIDGRPALSLYREYLGERASGLPATALLFPLAVRSRPDGPSVVRTVLSIDEATQSMTFAGDVPEGSLATLMRANFDRLVHGASEAAALASRGARHGSTLSLAISCVGRRLVLGERVEEEVEAVLERLPARTSQVGFYSYGELCPVTGGGCELHNQTMTLTVLSEA